MRPTPVVQEREEVCDNCLTMPELSTLSTRATEVTTAAGMKDIFEASKATRFCYGTLKFEKAIQVYLPSGTVDFPMSTEGASRLLAAGEDAPFGKGSQTVLDPQVR